MLTLPLLFSCGQAKVSPGDSSGQQQTQQDSGQQTSTKGSIFSRPTVERVAGQRKDWLDVDSFICYYGDFDDVQKEFDVAIMHSNTLYNHEEADAKAKVKEMQDAGTYVISYITIGEDDSLNIADGLGEGGYASYYIYENGFPKMNANWGSYFVDAGNPVWQKRVLDEAGRILSYGVDGLFLDTVDTVDVRPESLGGLVELIRLLKETYPEAKLVANRGFNLLKYVTQYIDGLMFESFNSTINFTTQKVDDLNEADVEYNKYVASNVINNVRRYDYFPVFCLDYCNEKEYSYMPQFYYDNSWKYDFIPYSTYDYHLSTPLNPGIKPQTKRGELALANLGQDSLGSYNGDQSAANLAYKENGAKITVDSTYPGYGTEPLNDGWYATEENHVQANWAREAWASLDNATDHYIEFTFPEQKKVKQVTVHWANDNGTFYQPQYAVVQGFIDNAWVDLCAISNEPEVVGDDYKAFEETWEYKFTAVDLTKLRIFQPKGMGCADKYGDPVRPNIMWVSEVEIYA